MTDDHPRTLPSAFRSCLPVPEVWTGQPAFDLDLDLGLDLGLGLVKLGNRPSTLSLQPHTASHGQLQSSLSPRAVPYSTSFLSSHRLADRHRTNTPPPHAWQIVTGPICPSRSCAARLSTSLFSPPARLCPMSGLHSITFYFRGPTAPIPPPLFHRFLAPPVRSAAHLRLTLFPLGRLITTNSRRNTPI